MSHVVSIIDPVQILNREILQQLESADPDWVGELRLLGTKPNIDLYFKDEPIAVQPATGETRKGVEIAIFGDTEDLAAGAVTIGLSDGHPDALIVHPALNLDAVPEHRGVLQVPDAAASTIAILANALDESIQSITGTILLPASTLGPDAIEELYGQTLALFNQQKLPTDVIGGRLAFNLLPGHANMEGLDALLETPSSLTTMTAPLFGGTTLALDFWFESSMDPQVITEKLSAQPSISIQDTIQPALIVDTDPIAIIPPQVNGQHVRIIACIDEVRRNASAVLKLAETVCSHDAF